MSVEQEVIAEGRGRTPRLDTGVARTAAAQEAAQRGAHLYIMQIATGLIKIGRSQNPENRRRTIQNSCGQPVYLLRVFKWRGNDERRLHSELAEHRVFGEWFANTGASRMAIGEALNCRIGFRIFDRAKTPQEAITIAIERDKREAEVSAAWAECIALIAAGGRRRRTTR